MKKINMTYIGAFTMVLFFTTTVSYANEVKRAPLKASDDSITVNKKEEKQLKRADNNWRLITNDSGVFKKTESPPPSQQYKPTYRKDTKYKFKKKVDIRKLQPRNPDEIYSCDKKVSDILYDDEVCARQIIVMAPCLIAPCPTDEHWSTYPSAGHACSHSDVTDFAFGRCLYDSEE
jgi:hypothetical protein